MFCFFDGTKIVSYGSPQYFEQDTQPTNLSLPHAKWFNTRENIIYETANGGNTWFSTNTIYLGKLTKPTAESNFTSMNIRNTFRAVDYNDKSVIVSWCMPDYSRATTWSTTGGIVPYDAKVILYNTNATNSGGAGGWVTVNGLLEYCVRGNAYEATSPAYVAYLPKGAIVEANNMNFAYIVPLKGVK